MLIPLMWYRMFVSNEKIEERKVYPIMQLTSFVLFTCSGSNYLRTLKHLTLFLFEWGRNRLFRYGVSNADLVWIDGRMDGWMDGWMDLWDDGRMDW